MLTLSHSYKLVPIDPSKIIVYSPLPLSLYSIFLPSSLTYLKRDFSFELSIKLPILCIKKPIANNPTKKIAHLFNIFILLTFSLSSLYNPLE